MAQKYELLADEYHETTSKPGDPFTFKTHRKGDKITLEADRARELIEAGAVKDPNGSDAGEPGGDTVAPKGKAEGVGTGDSDEGTVGDGGPDPQGTGSTATGDGGAAGDGQGSTADTVSSRPARRRGGSASS